MSKPRATNSKNNISVFYLPFVKLVSFIRYWISARRVHDRLLFVRFHCRKAEQLLKFMLAAITSLPATTMSTSNKIPSDIPLASTFRISPLRARNIKQRFNFTSERSASKVRIAFYSLSLCLVTRKFVEFSRDFSISVSFFSKRVFFLFFPTDFHSYAKEAEHIHDARLPWRYYLTGKVDTRRAFPRI